MHGTVRRSDLERRLDDELRFHIESYTTDLERAGCTGGGAQTCARRFRKRRGSEGRVPRCTRAPAARSAGDGWPVRMPATPAYPAVHHSGDRIARAGNRCEQRHLQLVALLAGWVPARRHRDSIR